MPEPPQAPVLLSDKVQHALAFLILAALGYWAYPRVQKRRLLFGLAVFGAVIELVQATPFVDRDGDPLDWVADIVAALTVFVAVAIWGFGRARRSGANRELESGS